MLKFIKNYFHKHEWELVERKPRVSAAWREQLGVIAYTYYKCSSCPKRQTKYIYRRTADWEKDGRTSGYVEEEWKTNPFDY